MGKCHFEFEVIVRGTTPIHKWKTGIDLSETEVLFIDYVQGDYTVEKTKADCSFFDVEDKHFLELKLTQEETLGFDDGNMSSTVLCQIRGRFADGTTVANCPPIEVPVGKILKGGVI